MAHPLPTSWEDDIIAASVDHAATYYDIEFRAYDPDTNGEHGSTNGYPFPLALSAVSSVQYDEDAKVWLAEPLDMTLQGTEGSDAYYSVNMHYDGANDDGVGGSPDGFPEDLLIRLGAFLTYMQLNPQSAATPQEALSRVGNWITTLQRSVLAQFPTQVNQYFNLYANSGDDPVDTVLSVKSDHSSVGACTVL